MSGIDYAVDGDGIATITWNLAERSSNVLTPPSVAGIAHALECARDDGAVKGILIASAKASFIVGADVACLDDIDDAKAAFDLSRWMHGLSRAMETGGKPVAAAINGDCLGGGLQVALACHRRIVADDPAIKLGLPEATIGLLPGAGGTQRLPRLIGIDPALRLMTEGKPVSPARALEIGLVDAVVPRDKLIEAARRWLLEEGDATQPWDRKDFTIPGGGVQSPRVAQTFTGATARLRAKSWGNYPAPLSILSCVYEGCQTPIDSGLKIEARYFADLAIRPQTRAMMRTMYHSVNAARRLKGRPAGVAETSPSRIGVLGAGKMGAGIAAAAAQAGIEVTLIDATEDRASAGKDKITRSLERKVQAGRMSAAERDAVLDLIRPTAAYRALDGVDAVIEAVVEDRALKAAVTARAARAAGDAAMIASNTSTLPITSLAKAVTRPQRFVGLHFFSPVERMPLVEVIRGAETDDRTVARALDLAKRLGKVPIVVGDGRGFFASRVFATYLAEGISMVAEGVRPALIENAGRLAGMPVGPLALTDEVSLELVDHINRQTRADTGGAFLDPAVERLVSEMVERLGRTGRKAGKGFYDYPDPRMGDSRGGEKRLWAGLADLFPVADKQPDVETLKNRLLHIQALEAVSCLRENIVASKEDANVGSILGWGFPAFTGGVLSYVSLIGIRNFVYECETLARHCGPRFDPPKDIAVILGVNAGGKAS